MNRGQKLWIKSKKMIPGGNSLFSKRPELTLPKAWPTYYKKSKGAYVWDLDDNKYLDMMFYVGTNALGYNNLELEKKIIKTIKLGNMTSLNCPEEPLLAKELISIHPWANMVRFFRSGGEANAAAIRIARAAANKDNVAICGYHGWHDWYLAATIKSKDKFNKIFLEGLPHKGVPKTLADHVFPFEFNDLDYLKYLIKKKNIGVVKMEVARTFLPEKTYLQEIRKITHDKKIILVFDECTSGFRETYGGLHKKFSIYPDLAMFGKALGNGHAITAVIGKKKVMKFAQSSFISSTFWGERIGFVAALETLKIMKKVKSFDSIPKIGLKIKKKWIELAKKNKLEINVQGLNSIPSFNFKDDKNLKLKTIFTKLMLQKKILASNVIFVSLAHDKKILNKYFSCLDQSFKIINKILQKKINIKTILKTPYSHKFFKRLN